MFLDSTLQSSRGAPQNDMLGSHYVQLVLPSSEEHRQLAAATHPHDWTQNLRSRSIRTALRSASNTKNLDPASLRADNESIDVLTRRHVYQMESRPFTHPLPGNGLALVASL